VPGGINFAYFSCGQNVYLSSILNYLLSTVWICQPKTAYLPITLHSYCTVSSYRHFVHNSWGQIGDKPYRWQVNSVIVNSVTSNRWQVSVSLMTVII